MLIQRGEIVLGILAIGSSHKGSLNTSQEYVFEAIAFEVADHLEARHTGEEKHTTEVGGSDFIARLRLLESVVVNATDAILITEAEPIDLPVPSFNMQIQLSPEPPGTRSRRLLVKVLEFYRGH